MDLLGLEPGYLTQISKLVTTLFLSPAPSWLPFPPYSCKGVVCISSIIFGVHRIIEISFQYLEIELDSYLADMSL